MAEQSYWERMRAGYREKLRRASLPPPPPIPWTPPPPIPWTPPPPPGPDEWEDCGYANGWGGNTPTRVRNCKHETNSREVGRCLRVISCDICKYIYEVDSGD